MIVIIRHLSDSLGTIETPLRKGKSLRFGGGIEADLRLTYCANLPDMCAMIWNGDDDYDGCILENITRRDAIVFLNGNPVHSVALVEDGDLVRIGVDEFHVFFRSQTSDPAPPPAGSVRMPPVVKIDPQGIVAPQTDYTIRTTVVNSALHRHLPVDAKWTQTDFLMQLFRKTPVILFVNFRLAGIDPAPRDLIGPDRFQEAPEEVRDIYSLHAITGGTPGQKLQLVEKLQAKDAVVVALPDGDPETCLAESKLFWSWFARPSVLELTLTRGSRELCSNLMKAYRGFVLHPRDASAQWVIYAKPGTPLESLSPLPPQVAVT